MKEENETFDTEEIDYVRSLTENLEDIYPELGDKDRNGNIDTFNAKQKLGRRNELAKRVFETAFEKILPLVLKDIEWKQSKDIRVKNRKVVKNGIEIFQTQHKDGYLLTKILISAELIKRKKYNIRDGDNYINNVELRINANDKRLYKGTSQVFEDDPSMRRKHPEYYNNYVSEKDWLEVIQILQDNLLKPQKFDLRESVKSIFDKLTP
jgi:hypothetical protein